MTAGSWNEDWKGVKVDFKEATGKSKPDTVKKVLGITTVHKTKIADKLKDVDESWDKYKKAINSILVAS